MHYYNDTGQFIVQLIVFSEDGCSDTLQQEVLATSAGTVMAPNVFFPNGGGAGGGAGLVDGQGGGFIDDDGTGNAIFVPLTEGVIEYHLEIYNRWGEFLFSSDVKNYGWAGYYKGKLCKEDVYVWKVYGKYSDGWKRFC